MFEELLVPREDYHLIQEEKVYKAWENKSGEIRFLFQLNGWYWNSIHPMVPKCNTHYKTLYQASKELFNLIKQLHGTEVYKNFDTQLVKLHKNRFKLISCQTYKDYNQTIVGQAGCWTFDDSQYWGKIPILRDISPQQRYFKTKPDIMRTIYQYLNNNLGTIYSEKDYCMFKEIQDMENFVWWVPFIKPEIDLTKVF